MIKVTKGKATSNRCIKIGWIPVKRKKYVQRELKTSVGSVLRDAAGGLVPVGK